MVTCVCADPRIPPIDAARPTLTVIVGMATGSTFAAAREVAATVAFELMLVTAHDDARGKS